MNDFKTKCKKCLNLFWQTNPVHNKKGYECLYNNIKPYIYCNFNNLYEGQKEDVVQNALIKIYQAKGSIIEYCSAWVRTVIKNEAIGVLRKETKHAEHRDNCDDDMIQQHIDATYFDDDFSKQMQFDAAVEKLIEHLEQESQGKDDMAIVMGLINGESHEEIAKSLGRTKGAVATRAVSIRKQLKPLYNMYFRP